jgi:metallophosphoesterase superfamily enzyme
MPSQLFLDTSVLLNYVQVWLEGDEGSVAIVEGNHDKFICTTVNEELDTRCSTRRQIYIDLRKFVEQKEDESEVHSIFNYEVLDFEHRNPSVPVTDNDRDHLRDLQMEFASIDDDDKFYELRKFIRSVKSRKRTVDGEVTVYSGNHKSDLVDDINSCTDNYQDSLVLAQGAAWRNDNSGDTVVTLDYGDMIDKESEINDTIEVHYSPSHRLNIVSPDAV